jgi:hypothetical protein
MPLYDLPNLVQTANAEVTADTSTTSATFTDLLSINITTSVGETLICRFGSASTNATSYNLFQIMIDGVVYESGSIRPGTGTTISCPTYIDAKVSGIIPGDHVVKVQWAVPAGTGYIRPVAQAGYEFASLVVIEDLPSYDVPITYGLVQTQELNLSVDVTTGSGTMIDLMSIFLYTIGGDLLIYFNANSSNSNTNNSHYFQILVDGVVKQQGSCRYVNVPAVNINLFDKITGLDADAHTVTIQWYTSGNTAQIRPVAAAGSESAELLVMEMKS